MNRPPKPRIHKKKSKNKPKLEIRHPRFSRDVDIFENDETAKFVPGSPGYRVARNRSGLGYLETRAEWARMQGLMIKWLVTGKFKTRNPIYIIFMILFGAAWASPIPLILFALFNWNSDVAQNLLIAIVTSLPYVILGILLLINAVVSLIKWNDRQSITGD
jgi:hypothetical protein